MRLLLIAALALSWPTRSASAQLSASGPDYHHAISVQPLWTVVNLFAADYERALGASPYSLSVAGAYSPGNVLADLFGDPNSSYLAGELKLRRYVGAMPLHGLAIAVSGGAVRTYNGDGPAYFGAERVLVRPTVGTEVAYTAVTTHHLVFSAGFGLKWRLGRRPSDEVGGPAFPLRAAIGYAF